MTRILLVDDDDMVRSSLGLVLHKEGFDVATASCVPEALRLITSEVYDVLLSDLHMPGAGDGLTVVSAMRHANPNAVTMILSAFPEMDAAAHAILLQADQIMVKPVDVKTLVEAIKEQLVTGAPPARVVETVATILEHDSPSIIDEWYAFLQTDAKMMAVHMTKEERTRHLPQVFRDLVKRLRSFKPIGSKELRSISAEDHGLDRRRRGYTSDMLVDESRMLQVTLFHALQMNLIRIDFSILLNDVMTIADEIDSQLSQAMATYNAADPNVREDAA